MRTKGWPAAVACAVLVLLPARLAVPPARPRAPEPPAFEADGLALAPPDLLGHVLGLPLGPRLEETAPANVASAPPAEADPLAAAAAFVAATSVPEPGWLALLSLASAAAASRGRRRCLPRRPGR
jgi:hypothetical protein